LLLWDPDCGLFLTPMLTQHSINFFQRSIISPYIVMIVDTATEFEEMLLTRRPEEVFAAEDETDWNEWVEFFSRTREIDGRRKGLVEIEL